MSLVLKAALAPSSFNNTDVHYLSVSTCCATIYASLISCLVGRQQSSASAELLCGATPCVLPSNETQHTLAEIKSGCCWLNLKGEGGARNCTSASPAWPRWQMH